MNVIDGNRQEMPSAEEIASMQARFAAARARLAAIDPLPGADGDWRYVVPHLLCFIMGFRDFRKMLCRPGRRDGWERRIAALCEADEAHWRWFLDDLAKALAQTGLAAEGWRGLVDVAWSERSIGVRCAIANLIHHACRVDSPRLRLLLIEIAEVAFDLFGARMRTRLEREGQWQAWAYFGERHWQADATQRSGRREDGATLLPLADLLGACTPEELWLAELLVDEVFGDFAAMFRALRGLLTSDLMAVTD